MLTVIFDQKTAGKTASKVVKKKCEKLERMKRNKNPQLTDDNESKDEEKIEEGVEVSDEEEEEEEGGSSLERRSPNGERQSPTVEDIDSDNSADEEKNTDEDKLENLKSETIREEQLKQTDAMSLTTK